MADERARGEERNLETGPAAEIPRSPEQTRDMALNRESDTGRGKVPELPQKTMETDFGLRGAGDRAEPRPGERRQFDR